MSKSRKLIVITSGSYPYGGAATNRHLSYLKGLVELGVDVKMLILQPSKDQSIISNKNNGRFNGIEYQYIIPTETTNKSLSDKVLNKIKAVKRTYSILKKEIKLNKDIKVLMLVVDPFVIVPILRLTKKNNIKTFHERTEFPFIGMDTFFKKQILKKYLRTVNRFDGIFVITRALVNYFSDYFEAEKLLHIPMTVEPDRFDCTRLNNANNKYGRYIAYCGSMYTDKDGVPILIKAFDKFADNYKDIKLVLIGDNSNVNLFQPIQKEILKAKNKDRIILTGKVDRDEMPELLCNAEVLALARPDNIQAKGGFPTKLGEYLATANPVVVTSVGEIPNYLTNNKNAFISKPDSITDFYDKLIDVYNNYDKAFKVGLEGKKLVSDVFNYRVQSKRIKEFIFNEK